MIRFLLTKARLSFADIYFEVDGIQWDGGDAQYLEQEDVTVSIALFGEDSVAPMSIGAPQMPGAVLHLLGRLTNRCFSSCRPLLYSVCHLEQ